MGIEAIIALIGSLVPVANNIIGFVNRTAEELRRNEELTPEQFEALRSHVRGIDSIDRGTHWLTDEERQQAKK